MSNELLQARFAVKSLKRKVQAGNARPEELAAAVVRLEFLEGGSLDSARDDKDKGERLQVKSDQAAVIHHPTSDLRPPPPKHPDKITKLTDQAKGIRRQMAELSNSLADSDDAKAAETLAELKTLQVKNEAIWTQVKYFERNGVLPEEDVPDIADGSPTDDIESLKNLAVLKELEVQKASLMNIRTKARKALQKESLKDKTRVMYEEKEGRCTMELDAINQKINALKYG